MEILFKQSITKVLDKLQIKSVNKLYLASPKDMISRNTQSLSRFLNLSVSLFFLLGGCHTTLCERGGRVREDRRDGG